MASIPIDKAVVVEAFAKCGVKEGDCMLLHADAMAAAQLTGVPPDRRVHALLDGVLDVLGQSGTLVMPTFSYSATQDEVFNPKITPSDVGLLTEHFRKRPHVQRSRHPIFSVAAVGPLAKTFADSKIDDCFGEGTACGEPPDRP